MSPWLELVALVAVVAGALGTSFAILVGIFKGIDWMDAARSA